MNTIFRKTLLSCLLLSPMIAHAYIGPGVGLSAIGSVLAFIGVALLLIIGFLWYPLKRLLNRSKAEKKSDDNSTDQTDASSDRMSD